MPNYQITHVCGHEGQYRIRPKYYEYERHRLEGRKCFECYKREQLSLAQAESIIADLPNLSGTERQVSWAMSLREKLRKALSEEIDDILYKSQLSDESKDKARGILETHADGYIRLHTEAKWWIDRGRFEYPQAILRGALGALKEAGIDK